MARFDGPWAGDRDLSHVWAPCEAPPAPGPARWSEARRSARLAVRAGAGIATGGFVDWARITAPWQEEMLGRLAGATAIIAGCGTLALLILARINQRIVPVAAALADLREIMLTCPRCRSKQTIALGSGKCGTCGLVIQVRVQEPKPEEQEVGVRMARF